MPHLPGLQNPTTSAESVATGYWDRYQPRSVTVTNLSQASLGRPSPRALKPRLRYKLNHGVVVRELKL